MRNYSLENWKGNAFKYSVIKCYKWDARKYILTIKWNNYLPNVMVLNTTNLSYIENLPPNQSNPI